MRALAAARGRRGGESREKRGREGGLGGAHDGEGRGEVHALEQLRRRQCVAHELDLNQGQGAGSGRPNKRKGRFEQTEPEQVAAFGRLNNGSFSTQRRLHCIRIQQTREMAEANELLGVEDSGVRQWSCDLTLPGGRSCSLGAQTDTD